MDLDQPPPPIVQYVIISDIILILLIATQVSTTIRFIGFCIFNYFNFIPLWFTSGNATQDYIVGFFLASQFLLAVQLLWLTSPVDELRHERDKIPARDLPLWRRAYWAFCLNHSMRAIGWTHQVRNIPPRPIESRWPFVRARLSRAAAQFLLADVANTYILYIGPSGTMWSQGYALRYSTIIASMCVTYGTTLVTYFTLASLSVGLGVTPSHEWPDLFGKWSDAYTLRNFWGKVWQQGFRRIFTPIGKFLTKLFDIKKGTNASSYTQLYAAFMLSGFMHTIADAMIGRKWVGTSVPFFIVQPVAITAEDAIIALYCKAGIHRSWLTQLVGYIWVFLWVACTFPMYRYVAMEAGWSWASEWPISPTGMLWKALGSQGERAFSRLI